MVKSDTPNFGQVKSLSYYEKYKEQVNFQTMVVSKVINKTHLKVLFKLYIFELKVNSITLHLNNLSNIAKLFLYTFYIYIYWIITIF